MIIIAIIITLTALGDISESTQVYSYYQDPWQQVKLYHVGWVVDNLYTDNVVRSTFMPNDNYQGGPYFMLPEHQIPPQPYPVPPNPYPPFYGTQNVLPYATQNSPYPAYHQPSTTYETHSYNTNVPPPVPNGQPASYMQPQTPYPQPTLPNHPSYVTPPAGGNVPYNHQGVTNGQNQHGSSYVIPPASGHPQFNSQHAGINGENQHDNSNGTHLHDSGYVYDSNETDNADIQPLPTPTQPTNHSLPPVPPATETPSQSHQPVPDVQGLPVQPSAAQSSLPHSEPTKEQSAPAVQSSPSQLQPTQEQTLHSSNSMMDNQQYTGLAQQLPQQYGYWNGYGGPTMPVPHPAQNTQIRPPGPGRVPAANIPYGNNDGLEDIIGSKYTMVLRGNSDPCVATEYDLSSKENKDFTPDANSSNYAHMTGIRRFDVIPWIDQFNREMKCRQNELRIPEVKVAKENITGEITVTCQKIIKNKKIVLPSLYERQEVRNAKTKLLQQAKYQTLQLDENGTRAIYICVPDKKQGKTITLVKDFPVISPIGYNKHFIIESKYLIQVIVDGIPKIISDLNRLRFFITKLL